jgi:cell volume regulation protein A
MGIPILIIFLAIGMFAGSDGPGGIEFDDPILTKNISSIALSFILFAAGLDTKLFYIKETLWSCISLSTLGVVITSLVLGMFAHLVWSYTFLESLLFGAIVSSTDAPAVFSILRSKRTHLKQPLQSLIELESGSNDPTAIILTMTLIAMMTHTQMSLLEVVKSFATSVSLGFLGGYIFGKVLPYLISKLDLEYYGLYPVLTISIVLITYSLVTVLGGSGFLAVYVLGLVAGQNDFIHKKEIINFHEGWGWFMQISMFLTLGLLVFPSKIFVDYWDDIFVALFLMFIARPLSVFLSLLFSKFTFSEKLMISWVGLRGAVPIILATFPFVAGIARAQDIFNSIFFIVIISILIQAPLIPIITKWLKLEKKEQ